MLISNGTENLVHVQQKATSSKPLNQGLRGLQPKTPGKFPTKTPIVVPLRDENAPCVLGGKQGKARGMENFATTRKKNSTFDKDAFVTPMGPRNRAPLGMKTTNAKVNTFQTPAGTTLRTGLENNKSKATSSRRLKKLVNTDTFKLEIHEDKGPLSEVDIEYCPPKPKELPYESDTFPDNCIDYSQVLPQNLVKDLYRKNRFLQIEKKDLNILEREQEEAYQRDLKTADEAVLKMMEEEWSIGDIPEILSHKKSTQPENGKRERTVRKKSSNSCQKSMGPPPRKNSQALPIAPKSAISQPKTSTPAPKASILSPSHSNPPLASFNSRNNTTRPIVSSATSKSTIGYAKGRGVPGISQLKKPKDENFDKRSAYNKLSGPVSTEHSESLGRDQKRRDPHFLKVFEVEDEDLEPELCGLLPDCVENVEEEDFVLSLPS